MLVVSPHLDDGIFSCGQVLAAHPGSTVATVLAGVPSADHPLTGWDARMGYESSRAAVLARREEDAAACAQLGAMAVWLDGFDGQYERRPDHDQMLAAQLTDVLRDHAGDSVFLPLGIARVDHELVAALARTVASSLAIPFSIYEELPYRVQFPAARDAAVERLWRDGWKLKLVVQQRGSVDAKETALEC